MDTDDNDNPSAGQTFDRSGNAYHGVEDSASWRTAGCQFDGCYRFSSSNKLSTGGSQMNFNGGTGWTVALWWYPHDTMGSGAWNNLVEIWWDEGSNARDILSIGYDRTNQRFSMGYSLNAGSFNHCYASGNSHPVDNWYKVAIIRDGSSADLWVDGTVECTLNHGTFGTQADFVKLGSSSSSTGNPWADMDEARVYNAALTSSQVTDILNNPYTVNPTADFTWTCTDYDCDFDASGSTGAGSLTYAWDFTNDGTTDTSTSTATTSHTYGAIGPRTVELCVTDQDSMTGCTTKSVYNTLAGFTYDCTPNGDGTHDCTFTVTEDSTGDPGGLATNPYEWSWGDGSADTLGSSTTVTHTYSGDGPWTATLTVSSSTLLSTGTASDTVSSATASFTYACLDRDCTFTDQSSGSGLTYAWDFTNDGTTDSTVASPSHTYAGTDLTFTAKLTVTDSNGDSDSTTQSVHITDATVTYTCDANGDGTYTCDFDAGSTTSGDPGSISSYDWTFGDGNTATTTGYTTTHTYTSTGPFNANVYVTANGGKSDSTEDFTVTVAGGSFSYACTEATCNFDGTTSEASGTITSYSWDLDGDGTEDATGALVTHTYTTAYGDGPWNVSLTVTDDTGATDTETQSVGIVVAAFANAEAATGAACTDDTCSFDAEPYTRNSRAATYTWDWGDGSPTSTGTSATHQYANAGPFTVNLTVTTSDGSDYHAAPAHVTYATFTVTCDANLCTFDATNSGTSVDALTNHTWAFGDGTTVDTATDTSTTHRYWSVGPFTPTLTVTNTTGAQDTATDTVTEVQIQQSGTVAGFTFIDAIATDLDTGTPALWVRDGGAGRAHRYSAALTEEVDTQMCLVENDLTPSAKNGGLIVTVDATGGLPSWACYAGVDTLETPADYGWARAAADGRELAFYAIQEDQAIWGADAYTLNEVAYVQAGGDATATSIGVIDLVGGAVTWTEGASGIEDLTVDRAKEPGERRVCATGDTLGTRCYDLASGVERRRISHGGSGVASWNDTVWVANGTTVKEYTSTLTETASTTTGADHVAVSTDGAWIAGATSTGTVTLYWATNLTPAATVTLAEVDYLAWSADANWIYAASPDTVWRLDARPWTDPVSADLGGDTDLKEPAPSDPSVTEPGNAYRLNIAQMADTLGMSETQVGWLLAFFVILFLGGTGMGLSRTPEGGVVGAAAGAAIAASPGVEWLPKWSLYTLALLAIIAIMAKVGR